MSKTVAIVGAGMAGLSTGCYAQMNGYQTHIYEQHTKPGGLCTAWKRKGYTMATTGWVIGSGPDNNGFHRMWQELGALQGREFIPFDEYTSLEGRDGRVFHLYTDIDRLEQHMLELAPEDKQAIAALAKTLRLFCTFKLPMDKDPALATPLDNLKLMIRMLPHMRAIGKLMKQSIQDLANEFKSPLLREVLPHHFFGATGSAMGLLNSLSGMSIGAIGYPVGGPLEFARAIEQRYLDLGGEVSYRTPVTGLIVKGDAVVGVRTEDGTEHRADVVISAADGHRTIFDWLGGKYVDDEIRGAYDKLPIYHPMHFVTLGVNRAFKEVPPLATGEVFPLPEPATIGRRQYEWLMTHIYNYDTNVAPEGKSLVKVMLDADYAYWKELRDSDRKRYRAEKEQIGEQLVAVLDQRFPGLADQVEVIDVSTPATFERYTGNWRGAWMGWVATPETMNVRVSKTLPGLDGFYMTGTWTLNGALAFAAMSGRHVTQLLCAQEKKRFVTSVP